MELENELLGLQMRQTVTGWRMDHRSGPYSDLAMAALFALESAPATITAEAAANWREWLADRGAPSAGGGSRFGPHHRHPRRDLLGSIGLTANELT